MPNEVCGKNDGRRIASCTCSEANKFTRAISLTQNTQNSKQCNTHTECKTAFSFCCHNNGPHLHLPTKRCFHHPTPESHPINSQPAKCKPWRIPSPSDILLVNASTVLKPTLNTLTWSRCNLCHWGRTCTERFCPVYCDAPQYRFWWQYRIL